MKHLNEELILSWISGDLAEDQLAMAKKHVDDCNTCFLRFSVLMKSQKDITGKSLEKAPSDVINKVKELLGLEQDEKRTEDFFEDVKPGAEESQRFVYSKMASMDSEFPSGPIPVPDEIIDQSYGRRLFATLTKPGPVLYSLTSVVAVVLIVLIIIRDDTDVDKDIDPSKMIERFTQPRTMEPSSQQRTISPSIMPDASQIKEGAPDLKDQLTRGSKIGVLEISIDKNILRITQAFIIKKELKVFSEEGDLIFETEFSDTNNSFTLPIKNNGSVRVIIESFNNIIYNEVLEIKNIY
jgi:hypothetical protein